MKASIAYPRAPLTRAAKPKIGSGANTAAQRKAEIGLRRRLRVAFKQMGKALAQSVLREYGDVYRGDELKQAPASIGTDIVAMLSQDDFDAMITLAEPYHVATAVGGAAKVSKSVKALGYDAHANLATANAEVWGRNRAAEMVGRKWVNGKLVDNPNAKWAINDSTRAMIRTEVERAISAGSTVSEIASALQSSVAFSEGRAFMVARTEMAIADTVGTMEGFRAVPEIKGKRWITAGDELVSDECQACEDEGVIPIDQAFSSGADAPPNHPNCRCVIVPAFEDEL